MADIERMFRDALNDAMERHGDVFRALALSELSRDDIDAAFSATRVADQEGRAVYPAHLPDAVQSRLEASSGSIKDRPVLPGGFLGWHPADVLALISRCDREK